MAGQDLEVIHLSLPSETLKPGFWSHRTDGEWGLRVAHMKALEDCVLKKRARTLILGPGTQVRDEPLPPLPGGWRGLWLDPEFFHEPRVEGELVVCSRMMSQAAYLVSADGAWRLHEHLAYWPRLMMWEAMLEVTGIEGGFFSVPKSRVLREG